MKCSRACGDNRSQAQELECLSRWGMPEHHGASNVPTCKRLQLVRTGLPAAHALADIHPATRAVRLARDAFLAACESNAGPEGLAAIAFTDPADAARFSAAQAACQALPTRDLCLAPQLGYEDAAAFSTVSGSTVFSNAAPAGIAADRGAADDPDDTAFLRGFRELLGGWHAACAALCLVTRSACCQRLALACAAKKGFRSGASSGMGFDLVRVIGLTVRPDGSVSKPQHSRISACWGAHDNVKALHPLHACAPGAGGMGGVLPGGRGCACSRLHFQAGQRHHRQHHLGAEHILPGGLCTFSWPCTVCN